MDKINSLDSLQFLHGIDKTRLNTTWKVNLTHISIDNHLRIKTKTGQEHLHLHDGCILRFIKDYKGIFEGTTTHISKRGNLNNFTFHEASRLLFAKNLIKGIIDGTKVRIYLFLEIARQKAKTFTCLNRRTC